MLKFKVGSYFFVALFAILFSIVDLNAGWFDSKYVKAIKNSELGICKGVRIEKMVNNFFGSPKWSDGVSKDGIRFVNVEGKITFRGSPVTALMQFVFTKDNKSFQLNALELNDIPQNMLMQTGLLAKMCEEAKK